MLTLDESAADERNKWGRLVFFGLPQGADRGRAAGRRRPGWRREEGRRRHRPGQRPGLDLSGRAAGRGSAPASRSRACWAARSVNLADLDHDGKDEIYVALRAGEADRPERPRRWPRDLPRPLPISGEPVAMDAGRPRRRRHARVALRRQDQGAGRRDLRPSRPEARRRRAASPPFTWGKAEAAPLRGLSSTPTAIRAIDVNRDGLTDVLVFGGEYADPACSARRTSLPSSSAAASARWRRRHRPA